MIIFLLVYLSSFLAAIKNLIINNKQGILVFLIFGLPIYTTSMAVALQSGAGDIIPILQPFKEILILISLGISIWELKTRVRLLSVDYAVLGYLAYTFLYVILPIGDYGVGDKLIALKSSSFFTIIYCAGRLFNPAEIYVSRYFHYILAVIIAATAVLLYEIFTDRHFHTLSGYADFNFYYFNQEPSGDFDLSWTFQTSTGLKRFSSFFANPLEFASSILIALAILSGLYTEDDNRIKIDALGITAFLATQLSIFFALSRSALASYFIMIFFFALITKKKILLRIIFAGFALLVVYFTTFMLVKNPDLYEFFYETITFTNPSSIGHVLAWLEGIESIAANPLGIGLGESGRVAVSASDTTGGENQFIIIGVQTGLISLALYMFVHIYLIFTCWKWYPHLQGKERKVCLALLLIKIGLIVPLMTSELESSVYISYLSWFLSGLFIHMISLKNVETKEPEQNPELSVMKK